MSLDFVHRFVPATEAGAPTLLLLHGTGGDENDLLGIGRALHPTAALLSPRGKVLEGGSALRFFRRLAEGVFDEADLIARTHELADFVRAAAEEYKFDPGNVISVGYSNGANIAGAMMMLRPEVLRGGILMRAMVPLTPVDLPDLKGVSVLLLEGKHDPLVPLSQVSKLTDLLGDSHAAVQVHWIDGGHGLTQDDIATAQAWLAERA